MKCDVKDLKGNHCPETPTHTIVIYGEEVNLCDRCYENVLAGAFGMRLTSACTPTGTHGATDNQPRDTRASG